jgi:hypothetical protein
LHGSAQFLEGPEALFKAESPLSVQDFAAQLPQGMRSDLHRSFVVAIMNPHPLLDE